MIDNNILINFFFLIFTIIILFKILKKKVFGPFIFSGWVGLFLYSSPILFNKARKLIYYDEYYLTEIDLEYKIVYFCFWLGFALALYTYKKNFYYNNNKSILKNNQNLIIFNSVCFFYVIIYLILRNIEFISISNLIHTIGKWIILFLLIGSVLLKKNFLIFFSLIAVIINAVITTDRTLAIIALFFYFSTYLYSLYKIKKFYFFNFLLKFFLLTLILFVILIYTKFFVAVIKSDSEISFFGILIGLREVFENLSYSFEPLTIFGHLIYVNQIYEKFSTIEYLYSIISNLLIFPSYFGLSSNYYNNFVMINLGFENSSSGVAGSIFASSYLAFGYIGVFIVGYFYTVILIFSDYYFKNKKNILSILILSISAILSIYIFRNAIDNFLSIVRQLIILFIFIWSQYFLIFFISQFLKKKLVKDKN
jgi:hypothetical protein